MTDENPFLEISPYESDGGELIGKLPSEVPLEILIEKFKEQKLLKAVRAGCIDCSVGDKSEVRKCNRTDCKFWPFRMGTDPFRKRSVLSPTEKVRRTERLQPSIEKRRAEAET